MGLVLNLIVQTIVWFGLMGAIIFGAAGTFDYAGGWLYLGEMLAVSVVLGLTFARVDPGLLRERLKPPVQKDQPLADKLIVIPLLVLLFGGMGFMAADAARWRFSTMPPFVQWAGAALLLAVIVFMAWTMRTNSFAAPVVKIQRERGQTVVTTGPYAFCAIRSISAPSSMSPPRRWFSARGGAWRRSRSSRSASPFASASRRRRCAKACQATPIMPAASAGASFRSSGSPADGHVPDCSSPRRFASERLRPFECCEHDGCVEPIAHRPIASAQNGNSN